ncbi:MAG: hypothetical protein OWS03_03925 [Alicyclobacillaceae bacterium]|nr:hypothetical protein [Alicyclobacillus sp. SP_1]MCY0895439.1 hypothetical protein [Alicyclobacillaceae bacterium]
MEPVKGKTTRRNVRIGFIIGALFLLGFAGWRLVGFLHQPLSMPQ